MGPNDLLLLELYSPDLIQLTPHRSGGLLLHNSLQLLGQRPLPLLSPFLERLDGDDPQAVFPRELEAGVARGDGARGRVGVDELAEEGAGREGGGDGEVCGTKMVGWGGSARRSGRLYLSAEQTGG